MPPKIPYREETRINSINNILRTTPKTSDMSPLMRKTDKYDSLGIDFTDTERSIIDFGETLWNLLGSPVIGKNYKRVDFPVGGNMSFTAEQGVGLYGQHEREDFGQSPEQDLKFTLSRYF